MTAPHPLSVRGKMLAFRYAWQGIAYMLRTQPNAWFQIGDVDRGDRRRPACRTDGGRVVCRGAGDGVCLDHRGAQHAPSRMSSTSRRRDVILWPAAPRIVAAGSSSIAVAASADHRAHHFRAALLGPAVASSPSRRA
jgi:hypothetical protein